MEGAHGAIGHRRRGRYRRLMDETQAFTVADARRLFCDQHLFKGGDFSAACIRNRTHVSLLSDCYKVYFMPKYLFACTAW